MPTAVRIARSCPEVRITLAPVGWAGSTLAAADVDAATGHRIEHELPEGVVADDAGERDREAQAGRAAGEDRRGAADGHRDRADDPLDLAERGHGVGIRHHDVRVDLAEHEDVEVAGGGGSHRQ